MIERPTEATIRRAGQILRGGGLIAFPTETVYGLGANAVDSAAVAKVFEVKGRPTFDPLIVHVLDAAEARGWAADWPTVADRLAEALWPGPLTLVVERKLGGGGGIADLVTAGLSTVGLRVPAHGVARRLLAAAGVPVAAPSANRFGAISPTRAEHVATEFAGRGDRVEMILDGGACETGVESTVVSVVGGRPVILRVGGVSVEAIEAVVGTVELARAGAAVASPGMLERHYAPRTPLRLWTRDRWSAAAGEKVGVLCYQEPPGEGAGGGGGIKGWQVEVLSASGDAREAAARLFAAMRRLDAAGVDVILAEPAPEVGLGRAINDRLRRASLGREPAR